MKLLWSSVPEYQGLCRPIWINPNQVLHRLDNGTTGFFKLVKKVWWWPWPVKYGEEFHGIIRNGNVLSTANMKGI